MSESRIDTVENKYKLHNADEMLSSDTNDIIDVSAFNFDDDERWLHVSTQCSSGSIVEDLHTWLRTEPELGSIDIERGTRRSIDTRTFTRPKKRINRMSFESIMEALSPPASNVWRSQATALTGIHMQVAKEQNVMKNGKEFVPAMLRPMSTAVTGLLSGSNSIMSGQESMEAFLNMSQSKGIDSFINLTEPEFSDVLMNMSEPSDLNLSIHSISRNDSMHYECHDILDDSEILTDSMMQTSMFGEVADIKNFDETFLKNSENDTTLENRNYSLSPSEKTVTNKFQTVEKEDLNRTFDTFTRKSLTSFTKQSLPLDAEKSKMDATFTSSYTKKSDLDSTLVNSQSKENKVLDSLGATYPSCDLKLKRMDITIDIKTDVPEVKSNSNMDVTINIPGEESKSSNTQSLQTHETVLNSTYNEPTSLRRELLKEVERSNGKKFDCIYNRVPKNCDVQQNTERSAKTKEEHDATYDHTSKNCHIDVATTNRYGTYRKDSSKMHAKSLNKLATSDASHGDHVDDHKFYTFTKKINNLEAKGDMENKEALENLDVTFLKPAPKFQRKLRAPQTLSKLPQFLRKSNPNLVSNSLKTIDMVEYSDMPNLRYIKGSQPNIARNVDGSLTNKLCSLGRLKSGSEQRLMEVARNVRGLCTKGGNGSTESIESTQSAHSAHSAPDLDDRLSTYSDSSHNSYSVRTMNIEQLQKIVQMQEESLKQVSTPKPNRRVLENTWIEAEKNLPSPILKNGVEHSENSCSSPRSVDSAIKTSSPLLSHNGSSQSINITGNHINEDADIMEHQDEKSTVKKSEVTLKG